MANSDEEDAYLYGSDNDDQPATKKQKLSSSSNQVKDKAEAKTVRFSDIKEEDQGEGEVEEDDEEDEEDEDESSDDDIDIIIGDNQNKKPSQVPGNDVLSEVVDTEAEQQEPDDQQNKKKSRTTITENSSTININSNPEYEGKPLTQLDIETLKVKPWRAPGANISDYFNFGFDEITWTAYCHKQDKLRGEFNPQKIMANIMKGPGQLPPPSLQPPGNGPSQRSMNNNNNPPMPIPPQFQNMSFNFGKMPPNMPQFPMGNLPPGMSYPPPPPPPQHQGYQNQRR